MDPRISKQLFTLSHCTNTYSDYATVHLKWLESLYPSLTLWTGVYCQQDLQHSQHQKDSGSHDPLSPSCIKCHIWSECLTTRCSVPCPYIHRPHIYLNATQSTTHYIPWWNPRPVALTPQCESVNTYTHAHSVSTSFHAQGHFWEIFEVQWPPTCNLYESYSRSCAWSRDVDVWWWGTQRWEDIKQVNRLVSPRDKMHREKMLCMGPEILDPPHPYLGWHHHAWHHWRVSN